VLELVSGKADSLTGRYFRVTESLDRTLADAERILAEDLLTLRLRI